MLSTELSLNEWFIAFEGDCDRVALHGIKSGESWRFTGLEWSESGRAMVGGLRGQFDGADARGNLPQGAGLL